MSDCPFKVGDVIVERQYNGQQRRVVEIVPDSHIICKGLTRTRISWRNLKRYRLVAR